MASFILIYCLLINGLLPNTYTFNIETTKPIIRNEKYNSGFGFAVSGHLRGNAPGVIVGAPSDGNSGSIYWCLFTDDFCQRIDVDIQQEARATDEIGHELFGYSLSTVPFGIDQHALACAPRLSFFMTGKLFVSGGCFKINNQLTESNFVGASPCLNIPGSSGSINLRYCTIGASVAQYKTIIMMGSPYYEFSKGTELIQNSTELYRVKRTETESLGDYSLLGSSTAVSDLIFGTKMDLNRPVVTVMGAPGVPLTNNHGRLNTGTGFVTFMVVPSKGSYGQVNLPFSFRLDGLGFGSRFGHAIQLCDVNGDGWDDLIVGAPYQRIRNTVLMADRSEDSKKDATTSRKESAYGAVYVFFNQKQRIKTQAAFSFDNVQIIEASENLSSKSGFGSSITRLGDINHDGVDDFAVGAPLDDSGGVVFVFHGSPSGRIKPPTQIISAKDFKVPLKTFGFSVGVGGMDLDGNGYPDLVVGATESSSIVVMRTRPVIKVDVHIVRADGSSKIELNPKTLEDCTQEAQKLLGYKAPRVYCMNAKILTTFNGVDGDRCQVMQMPADLAISINAAKDWLSENFTAKPQEVIPEFDIPTVSFMDERMLKISSPELQKFYQNPKEAANVETKLPVLLLSQIARCRETAFDDQPLTPSELRAATSVKIAFRDINLVDISASIKFGVKFKLDTPPIASERDEISRFPIYDPREITQIQNITFFNECENRQCQSKLLPNFHHIVARDRDGAVVFVGDDSSQSIEVDVGVSNRGPDPSFLTSVYSAFPDALLELDIRASKAVLVRPGLALCHFVNPLAVGQDKLCAFKFTVLGHQLVTASENFTINTTVVASTQYPPTWLNSMADQLIVKVKMSVNVSVEGNILPDAAYFSGNVTDGIMLNAGENKIGSTRLLIRLTLQNLRQHSLVPKSKLVIDWPYEIADNVGEGRGKFMFYLLETPYVTKREPVSDGVPGPNTSVVCDSRVLKELVNPYNYRVFKVVQPAPRGIPVALAPVDLPAKHPATYPPLKPSLEIAKLPEDGGKLRGKTTTLSCYNGQLRCKQIVCDLGTLSHRAGPITLEMSARLWDNTMRQNFKDIFLTKVQMSATWRADVTYAIDLGDKDYADSLFLPKLDERDESLISVVAPSEFELQAYNEMETGPVYPKNMSLYIGLAVSGGILLLAILIIILWKAKFFERKKFKRKLQRENATTDEGAANQPLQSPSSHSPELPSEAAYLSGANNQPAQHNFRGLSERPKNNRHSRRSGDSLHSPPLSAYGPTN